MDRSAKLATAYFGILVLVCGLIVGSVHADIDRNQRVDAVAVSEGYKSDPVTTLYRDDVSAPESFTDLEGAGAQGVESIKCGGYASVSVSAWFATASATAELVAARYTLNPGGTLEFRSRSTANVTAGGAGGFTNESTFPSTQNVEFSTNGCHILKVYVGTISTGTLGLFAEVY